jgi:drug/metabolite transporter (DMT)-like permease
MIGWGIFLIILGAGSLLLPLIDVQFRLMELVDPWQPFAGIVVAVIGVALVLYGMNRRTESAATVAAPSPTPPPETRDYPDQRP